MTKPVVRPALLLMLAACAGLGACSRSEPEQPPESNLTLEQVEPPAPEPTPSETAPAPEPTATENDSLPLPPAEEAAPDEQMLDDASATGMTAHSSRDEDEAELPANASR